MTLPDQTELRQELLLQMLYALEEQAVEWHKECEEDIKESGYPNGDGKELRRARKGVLFTVDQLIADAEQRAIRAALERVKYRLPSPDNNVEEWRGHNLGLSQAISVIDSELAELEQSLRKEQE